MKLLGIEMPFEEFDRLLCEQSNGKELKVIDGKVVAIERVMTQEELEAMKQEEYENAIVDLIRQRYSLNQELAILRQRDTKPTEFAEYDAYVEQCKNEIKSRGIN